MSKITAFLTLNNDLQFYFLGVRKIDCRNFHFYKKKNYVGEMYIINKPDQ